MCGRYVLVQKIEVLEKRFNIIIPADFDFKPSYNIAPGQMAPVITSQNPKTLQLFQFGLTPFWAKKKMYLFNARTEGDRNKENNPDYHGPKDIITKPAYRKPIRSQRCLVPADAFIEGSTANGLDNPYLVYLENKERPFCFAGIYDQWQDPKSGEFINSFSILTTTANSLLQAIPHHRSPVILPRSAEKYWLKQDAPLTDITKLLKPYPSELMNAYPISASIKNPAHNYRDLILPQGKPLKEGMKIRTHHELKLQGMGNRKKKEGINRHTEEQKD